MVRLLLAIWVGKLISFLTRMLNLGGGSAAPGLYALKFDPDLIIRLASQIKQNVVISGTNGKTTTAKFLAHFSASKYAVIRNSTGSNLERGLASTLLKNVNWQGKINADLGIWEVDEAAFNKLVFKIKPQVIILLNAFRDQLDRYGEVDSVVNGWRVSLSKINWEFELLLNASDPNIYPLGKIVRNVSYFQVNGLEIDWEKGADKLKQHQNAEYKADITRLLGLEGIRFDILYPGGKDKVKLNVPGAYHVFDFLAAFAAGQSIGLDAKDCLESVESFQPAFGRVESVNLGNKEAVVLLIKNPVGATLVFETVAPSITNEDVLVLALNDNFADGKDVSWIWDAHFERLVDGKKYSIICSGQRAEDLALRLKYAGIATQRIEIESDLTMSIQKAKNTANGRIYILPTYTAMLGYQKLFTKLGAKEAYWRGM